MQTFALPHSVARRPQLRGVVVLVQLVLAAVLLSPFTVLAQSPNAPDEELLLPDPDFVVPTKNEGRAKSVGDADDDTSSKENRGDKDQSHTPTDPDDYDDDSNGDAYADNNDADDDTPDNRRDAGAIRTDPPADTIQVALLQGASAIGGLLVFGLPIAVLSYCTLGAFGCLAWPALQGAAITVVGNRIARQKKGALFPMIAGASASTIAVFLGVATILFVPGVGPFVPPIPGVPSDVAVALPILLIFSAPVFAAAASIAAYHFDVEAAPDDDDEWTFIPPLMTLPKASPYADDDSNVEFQQMSY